MRISQDWLNQYVDTPSEEELEHLFEMAGIGVEERDNGKFALEITSNRGDWLSAFGLAREIAAMTGNRLRFPKIEEPSAVAGETLKIEIANPEDCSRYHATLLDNLKIGESPSWLKNRLIEGGMRPQNNVVDITNYVMLEMGQPLHAFDADSLPSPHILVRRAKEGESLITLDGMEHQLTEEVLCITDGKTPIAVAGVMGGADSEVKSGTTKVLLEAAHFAPSRVRACARALGFGTEASRRFERWVDPSNVAKAAARATQLLCELAGAKVLEVKDLYAAPLPAQQVEIRLSRTNAILGLKLDLPTISKLLEQLQLKVLLKDNSTLVVETPTWRNDISREIDLIEEVARLHGYDKIPETLPAGSNVAAGRSLVQRLEEKARSLLLRSGLQEVVTYSLENAEKVAKAGLVKTGNLAATPLILRNPLSEDYTQLRTSLLPSLLAVLQKNAGNDPKAEAARIFDLARVYLPKNGGLPNGLPDERRRIGLALTAAVPVAHWQKESALADFFSLKAIVENLLEGLGAANAEFRAAANPPFHAGRCASIALEGEDIGVMGEVHPSVQEAWDLPQRAYVALLDFDALVRHLKLRPQYQPIPKYPPVDRDLAILIDNTISAAKVNSVIKAGAGDLLERLDVFDLYTGPPVPEGQKSLALSLRFRDSLRTLNDGMVDELIENVVKALEVECDAKLRG